MSAVRQVETRWAGEFADVPAARSWARGQLDGLGANEVEWELLQVLSELVSNAAIHARSPFLVRLTADAGTLRLEVTDESPSGVTPRNYAEDATTGRGMVLVSQLTQDWGVTVSEAGKTVWADFVLGASGGDDESEAERPSSLHLVGGSGKQHFTADPDPLSEALDTADSRSRSGRAARSARTS